MRKALIIIFIIVLIAILIYKPRKSVNYSNKIDSIESKLEQINTKRDSIKERIDTVVIKLKENDKYYKETINSIITNDINSDYIFFTNYLINNSKRLDSLYNCDSTKTN